MAGTEATMEVGVLKQEIASLKKQLAEAVRNERALAVLHCRAVEERQQREKKVLVLECMNEDLQDKVVELEAELKKVNQK